MSALGSGARSSEQLWSNAGFPSKPRAEQVFSVKALSDWRRATDPGKYAPKNYRS